jgi:hypothetical protein
MTKKNEFGIKINSKPELKTDLIKRTLGHIPNSERNLLETEFITEESVKAGNDAFNQMNAELDKDFKKAK